MRREVRTSEGQPPPHRGLYSLASVAWLSLTAVMAGGTAIADESASGHVNVCSGLSLVSPAGPAAGCRFAAIGDDLRLH